MARPPLDGCTWAAIHGDDPLKIMQCAGHAFFGTTQGYIRTDEAIGQFGEVFPPLPSALFGLPDRSSVYDSVTIVVGQPGLEPETNRLRVYCSTN